MNSNSTGATVNHLSMDLIRRAQRGDSDAFATLFHTHKMRVYSLCLRMTNNAAEAEDLAQDAFLQVFRKLATFRGDSALSTWLYRIAVNTVLMHFRKRSVYRVSLDEPYTGQESAKQPTRREYGARDGRLKTSVAGGCASLRYQRASGWLSGNFSVARSGRISASGDCGIAGLFRGNIQVAAS